jgi:hypothetical protein
VQAINLHYKATALPQLEVTYVVMYPQPSLGLSLLAPLCVRTTFFEPKPSEGPLVEETTLGCLLARATHAVLG